MYNDLLKTSFHFQVDADISVLPNNTFFLVTKYLLAERHLNTIPNLNKTMNFFVNLPVFNVNSTVPYSEVLTHMHTLIQNFSQKYAFSHALLFGLKYFGHHQGLLVHISIIIQKIRLGNIEPDAISFSKLTFL